MGSFDQILCQCVSGNAVNASTSVLAPPRVWAKIVLTPRATAGACLVALRRARCV